MRTILLLALCVVLTGCESDEEKLVRLRQEEALAALEVHRAEARLQLVRDSAHADFRIDSAELARLSKEEERVSEAEAKVEIIKRDIDRLLH